MLQNLKTTRDTRYIPGTHPSTFYEKCDVHKQNYDLQAWALAPIHLQYDDDGYGKHLILSGGDDSCLLASYIEVNYEISNRVSLGCNLRSLWTDCRGHEAGVTAILPLPPLTTNENKPSQPSTCIPFLTGCYDEQLRLFTLDPQTYQRTYLESFKFDGGGVWRIQLLDHYAAPASAAATAAPADVPHYILLVSAMHAGAFIARLTYETLRTSLEHEVEAKQWKLTVAAKFTKAHHSMVYACDAVRGRERGKWTVVSTSMYDRVMCTWVWKDEMAP